MTNKETMLKLIGLLKGNGRRVSAIIFFLLCSSMISIISPLISRMIMDDGFLQNNRKVVFISALLVFGLVVLDNILEVCKENIRAGLKADITYNLFKQSFYKFQKLSISELNKKNNTELLNDIYSDINNVSMIADGVLFITITQIFNIVGGAIGLCIISWKLTLLVMLFIPVKFFVIKILTKTRSEIMNKYIYDYSEFANWFGDTLGGIKEIRVFGVFKNKISEFKTMQKNLINMEKKLAMQTSYNTSFDSVLQSAISTTLYIIGGNMVFNLQLSIGSITSFIAYALYCVNPISALFNLGMILTSIIPSTKRYYSFLELDSEEEGEDSIAINEEMKINPRITFNNVSFSYDKSRNALKDINFSIKSGEKAAIIGLNGSGKSTIISLLMRFYKCGRGCINFNDINIDNIKIDDYRRNISLVSQDSYLFNDTIKNNICLYKDISSDKFMNILKDCNLDEFYNQLPEDYKVGENGCMLSGGQRQKVIIARALATENNFIILDEATSNIDIDTENQINELIGLKLKGKTVLVISHKPNILKYMDKIIVLDKGQITAVGNHEKLLKESRVYNEILFNR